MHARVCGGKIILLVSVFARTFILAKVRDLWSQDMKANACMCHRIFGVKTNTSFQTENQHLPVSIGSVAAHCYEAETKLYENENCEYEKQKAFSCSADGAWCAGFYPGGGSEATKKCAVKAPDNYVVDHTAGRCIPSTSGI